MQDRLVRAAVCHRVVKLPGIEIGIGAAGTRFIDVSSTESLLSAVGLRFFMKRCLLVLLVVGCAYAAPVPSTLIANVPGRTTVNLNGAWHAIVDPFDNGKGGFFRNEKPKNKSERVEYSFDA